MTTIMIKAFLFIIEVILIVSIIKAVLRRPIRRLKNRRRDKAWQKINEQRVAEGKEPIRYD